MLTCFLFGYVVADLFSVCVCSLLTCFLFVYVVADLFSVCVSRFSCDFMCTCLLKTLIFFKRHLMTWSWMRTRCQKVQNKRRRDGANAPSRCSKYLSKHLRSPTRSASRTWPVIWTASRWLQGSIRCSSSRNIRLSAQTRLSLMETFWSHEVQTLALPVRDFVCVWWFDYKNWVVSLLDMVGY